MKVSINSAGKKEVFLTPKEFKELDRLAVELVDQGSFDSLGAALDRVIHWHTKMDTAGGLWGWIDPRLPVWIGDGYFHQ